MRQESSPQSSWRDYFFDRRVTLRSSLHFQASALLLFSWLIPLTVVAHPAIDAQVAIVNQLLEQEPGNAVLYFKRGQLHQAHRQWEAAVGDYRRALDIDPGLKAAQLRLGETLFEAGRPADAKRTLDEFLSAHADHADGFVLRGRVLQQTGDFAAAAADYDSAIALSARAQPDWYLQRARAASADGQNFDQAINGLDEGMARLGPLITLQAFAIDLEQRRRDYEAALTRVDRLLELTPRQPPLLVKRADLLALAGRFDEARAAYAAALQAIEARLPSRQYAKAMVELAERAKLSLAELVKKNNGATVGDLTLSEKD